MYDSRTIVPKNVFLSIKWEPIVPEFRIPSGTDWTLMDDSRNIVPENEFLSVRGKDGTVG